MKWRWFATLVSLAALAAGCGAGGKQSRLVVGVVEDAAKSGNAQAEMRRTVDSGFHAVVLSSLWTRGQQSPTPAELAALQTATNAAAADKVRPIVAVYQFSSQTPTSPGRPGRLRRLRRGARQRPPKRCRRDRRQRAEPQPLLDATVRRLGCRRCRGLFRVAARPDLRRRQSRAAERAGDRRRHQPARLRQPVELAAHPLADTVPARPRRRLPRLQPRPSNHGRPLDPPLRRKLTYPTDTPPPQHNADRDRRLFERS